MRTILAGKGRKTQYIFFYFLFFLTCHILPAQSQAEDYLSLYQSAIILGDILEKGIDSLPEGCKKYQPEFDTICGAVRDFYQKPFDEENRKKIQDARRALTKFSNDCMPGKKQPPPRDGPPQDRAQDRSEQPTVTLNVPGKDQGEVQPLVLESRSWQSDVIYGMSDFIVDRAKQELVIVFLEEFKRQLEDRQIYRDFFQNTYGLLSSYCDDGCKDADDDVEQFLTDGRSLNAALKEDMKNFLNVAMERYLTDEAKKIVKMATVIADGVERGLRPEWIFNRLRLDLKLDPRWPYKRNNDFRRGLYIISSFAMEYYADIQNVRAFVGTELLGKEHELFAYMLFAEAHADRGFSQKLGFATPEEKDRWFERFWVKLQRLMLILEKAKVVSDHIEFRSRAEPLKTLWDPLLFKSYSLAIADAVDFVGELIKDGQEKRGFVAVKKDLDSAKHELDKAKKALKDARKSKKDFKKEEGDLQHAIEEESLKRDRYLKTVKEDDVIWLSLFPKAVAFHNAIKSEEYNKAVVLTLDIMNVYLDNLEKKDEVTNFYTNLHKYLSFSYHVATAKGSEDVKMALKDAAMPAGGFRVKAKKKDWTITINSYLGLGGGIERLEETELETDWGYHVSPWAPVGLEAHFKDGKMPWLLDNFGFFLSILDLGAVASYRISEKQSVPSTAPEIGLAQVISPGFFYIKSLTERAPLSLGFGVHFTPRLHKVRENDIETHANSLRFSLFLAIDIPLFTIY